MQCYIDAKDGTTREAVAVCAECGAGLCLHHLVDEEMPKAAPPGLSGAPERGRLILCEECAEIRRGMSPAQR